jgi:uncharacterized OB-fold protein
MVAAEGASSLTPVPLADGAWRIEGHGPVLMGARCASCGALAFPRPTVCSSCMSETFIIEPLPRRGRLYSWTTVHVGAPRMNKPMMIGYVDLENGVRVFSHLSATGGPLAINQPVELALADVGVAEDGRPIRTFVFTPASGEGQ